ncbi:MAG: nucleotidyl transferase AbiEii/AbiGii toxin family protein [Chloroflexi bacterium]|nr:nucleotidyl transferase AbiEii/AbiGii toxin family protein [Chloroflexota bacterium]
MIGLTEIRRKAAEAGLGLEVIERDYVLNWLLWGLFTLPPLRECTVFKGGTALRKAYFADYRFSQDLDVTLTRPASAETLQAMLSDACRAAMAECGIGFSLAKFAIERDEAGEEAFSARLAYAGPRQQQREPARLKVDLTAYDVCC